MNYYVRPTYNKSILQQVYKNIKKLPVGQEHEKPYEPTWEHDPPFWQGVGLHGL